MLPTLPAPGWMAAWGALALTAAAIRRWRLAALALGVTWALLHAHVVIGGRLPAALEGIDLPVIATVESIPVGVERGVRFDAQARLRAPHPQWREAKRLRLAWYEPGIHLRPGERWELVVRLRRPNGFQNPGGRDHERWLFAHRVHAVGYVRRAVGPHPETLGVRDHLDRGRADALDFITETLEGRRFAGIIGALGLGIRSGMSSEQWEILRGTGTAHLMAISGLHVGLAAAGGFLLASLLARWTGAARAGFTCPQAGAAGAVACAVVYAALAGLGLPTQRALVMVVVGALALARRQQAAPSAALALAALVVVAWDPLAVLTGGFWLSFAAVAVLLYVGAARAGVPGRWQPWLVPQVAIGVGLSPLVLMQFGAIPWLSPVANLVAIPWISFVVVPLTLAGVLTSWLVPPLARALLGGAEWAVGLLWPFLELVADAGVEHRAPIGLGAALLAACGVAVLLAPRGLPGRWVGALALVPMACTTPQRPGPSEAWLTVLDVGQGLAVVVETRERVLVYDTGARFGPTFDAGAAVVVPFLRRRGWAAVDTLVLSHGDGDHVGGVESLARELPVREVLTNAEGVVRRAAPCVDGSGWRWGEVAFDVLHPSPMERWARNDGSCVVRVTAGGMRALLPGDIERRAEATLVARARDAVRAEVLVAPHHGSATSSSAAFLAAVQPAVVLVSAGYRNRYGMPAPAVVRRLESHGARVYRTDEGGALEMVLGGSHDVSPASPPAIAVRQYREVARRYWHRREGRPAGD